ncbi:MAG: glycoside hydrolase, partial [Defluviitaleaceae bacterium]|nr:glycoside hydrolase [Defluviitaleaceae bacterium]
TGELFYADYWTMYEDESGGVPKKWRAHLMRSADGGRSWEKRGAIAHPTEPMEEPMAEFNCDGDLVCAIRGAKTMFVAYSFDRGFSWTPPKPLYGYGVLPQLLRLKNGVMVLAFGRSGAVDKSDSWPSDPETVLLFSTDGGYQWGTKTVVLRENEISPTSCGYTCLLALDERSFLIGYPGAQTRFGGSQFGRKQLLVRRVTVDIT